MDQKLKYCAFPQETLFYIFLKSVSDKFNQDK